MSLVKRIRMQPIVPTHVDEPALEASNQKPSDGRAVKTRVP